MKCNKQIISLKKGLKKICPFNNPCPMHTGYWTSKKFKDSLKRDYGKYKKRKFK